MQSYAGAVRRQDHNSSRDALPGRNGRGSRASRQVSVALESGPEAISAARMAVEALADRVESDALDDTRLLISELVTNSIRHSHAATSSHVRLEITLATDTLRVEVIDAGEGFEPRPRAAGQSAGSGWGLYLVDRLTDCWGVATNGGTTRVWFELQLRSRAKL
jgi:anti-sigma regulatory factor (Ser/Thr protein kinase)